LTSGQQQMRTCVSCGRQIPWDANVCQFCGHDYRAQATAAPPHEKGALSLVGGILILIAGIIGLVTGILLLTVDLSSLDSYGLNVGGLVDTLESIIRACGGIFAVLGIIALLGGYAGIRRKWFGLAIAGGVLGLFVVGPYGIASVLSLVGLILVAVARKDFD
jgi:hypothetical protein